ncbi:quinidine resistance 1 [Fusarium denticulatum]|uniref:Quinidine resistance 1 n=1 Tax=Fusarium denticulatum TaxID=48507 RepID=A0A8H5XJY1_9HYPO|nr:quinidine resistance 1 [Fusarium denticulatum]
MSAIQDEAFSVYGLWSKRLTIVSVSLFALLGTMSTSMYYPALPTVASDLGVSITDVNLSVTTFMILQGIAPTFVGSFSDSSGRRLAYIACFSIFLAANIALALQNTYSGLLALRCVQSAGAGGLIPLASGVIADIVEPAERGLYMTWATVAPVLGPALAPVLGGVLTRYLDSLSWMAFHLLVPGYRMHRAGGSRVPPRLSQPFYFFFTQRNKQQQGEATERKPMSFPNPFAILKVVLDTEGAVVLAGNGVVNILIAGVNTGLPPLMTSLYGLSEAEASLCFLAFGIGSAVCTVITGRLMDRAYRRTAAKHNIPLKLARRDPNMPVEHARLQVTWPHIAAAIAGLLGYGWTLNKPTHLAGPMAFLFVIGYTTTAVAQALNALMVDLFPRDAATANAANNLIRCGLGAAITAVIQPMTDAVKPGWTYTIFAGFLLTIIPFFIALTRFGPGWRAGRVQQDTRDQEEGRAIMHVIERREVKVV